MITDHQAVSHTIAFLEKHGYALLFIWVLAEQGAIPLPSIPLLLAAGALIRTGSLHVVQAIGCCVLAALLADSIWFQLGRRRGRQVLRVLCRVSLEPDSCVRRTEDVFGKYGMRSLLVSKFVPGLNAVAAPLAGSSTASMGGFLLYDCAGASLWSGTYLAVGYIFAGQLETMLGYATRMGSSLFLLLVAVLALWIGGKFAQRRRFLKQLDVARITPVELRDRLNAGEDLFIVDLRRAISGEMLSIPGAVRISTEDLISRAGEIPRDRDIVLFCS